MIDFALYVFVSLSGAASILGHIPLTERLIRRVEWAYAWWTERRTSAAPEAAPNRPRSVPSWAHTEPYEYDEAA